MKKIFTSVLLCASIYFYAQSGTVSGNINDDSKITLPGAKISLTPGNIYTTSDEHGNFVFLNVPTGNYTMKVDYLGYGSAEYNILVEAEKNTKQNIVFTRKETNIQEVVVTGATLKNQARALNKQKNNANITNVISSDQIGRFPDANIGDALKRVPGITIQNDQGEARNLIIRGLAPNLNSVTLNGDRIPSAEGDNRNVQMDLIPSDMIATIEVNKTLTPDMDADAIGGSVNLITRASPNGQRISATLAGGYNPIREKGNYTAGFVYGNRFLNKKLGAVFSFSYNNNNFGSDNIEPTWSLADDVAKTAYISKMGVRYYNEHRIRHSFDLNMDYEFNSKNKIYASAMYNFRNDKENRYALGYKIKPTYNADESEITGWTGSMTRQNKGGDSDNDNTRLEKQKVQNYALRGEHLLGSKIDLDWSMNYATASEKKPHERYIEFERKNVNFLSDLSDPERPMITPTAADNLGSYKLSDLSDSNSFTQEKEFGAKVNLRFPFSVIEDQKGRLRVGARLRLKQKERDNDYYAFEPVNSLGSLLSVPTTYLDGHNFQAGNYVPGTFVNAGYLGGLDLFNPNLFNGELKPEEFLSNNYSAKEHIYAGYIRWDQDFSDKFSMIAGARIETTSIDYTGNYVKDEEDLVGKINNKNTYTNILPNISFKYVPEQNLVLRAAFTTALARPNYYALVPFLSVISADELISAGNPNLKATYAYNFDFMAEKYFKSVGILSGGLFYKNLKDFIYTYSRKNYTAADFSGDFAGQTNPIPAGESNWRFTQQRNGDNVDIYGFEVALQRQLDFIPGAFWKGLGVYVNYTYTKSKAKGITNEAGDERTDVGLPGAAPHMFNGSLSWENKRFSARVSMNYASSYIDELGGNSFEDRYYDKQLFLDANASYKITSQLRVFAEANNLTNQPLRYYQGIQSRTTQVEYYRPRFTMGVKFDF
ncbi:TonB-dependent receptor [Chryseobacterium sp. T16E-39]|uniref:TonB-dependent receptor n=1 Tax=Chryseobacterium sp. T16E-39 TaxID=2015076 RepID=UPI000B5B4168|nr:TonB-dependent receptor [Chryseobacterium sp. T16E-39]ASK28921.1 TonB-dependent receptor [Chryseobacterium sp. T16E-39]